MSSDKEQSGSHLVRGLGLVDAGALVVGCIIGTGIFRLSYRVAESSPSPLFFMLAWVLGGVVSMAGALCYAEMAALFPRSGGDYVFITEAYGKFWGFLFGWTKIFVERTGTIAIMAFIFAEHAGRVMGGLSPFHTKTLATAAILSLTLANIAGLRFGKRIQNTFTALKIGSIGLIILAGMVAQKGSAQNFQPLMPEGPWSPTSLGVAMIFVLWAYGGWTEAAYVGEEVKDPGRNLPRAIVGGLAVVTALYLTVNLVYLYYLPLGEMRQTKLVAAETMDRIWAGKGAQLFSVMVMASAFGALNGFVLTGGRILYALAKDHALFRKFAEVSPRTKVPTLSLVVNALLGSVLVWAGTLDQLVTYTEIVISIFFAMAAWALFIFRKRMPDAARTYRVWLYPLTPVVFILLRLGLAANGIYEQPKESLFGFALAAVGIPLYLLSRKISRKNPAF
jgi:basic amino acid/polyamine antiporter, APA family